MNIGIVGFGKLGGPIAVAIAYRGYRVLANDIIPERVTETPWPYQEAGYDGYTFDELRETGNIQYARLDQIVVECDLIFVIVQTPHKDRFDGTHLLGKERADFGYDHLEQAIYDLHELCRRQQRKRTIVVVSTVLPGTMRDRLVPLIDQRWVNLIYNPAFPAMGTAVRDFLCPEFVLLGLRNECAGEDIRAFYWALTRAPLFCTGYTTAEAIKVLYNTYISSKIVFANAAMELCHKVGANVDNVSQALGMANRRITSPAYMCGGMGDGGACHPRDLIAMSWLAQKVGLSHDLFSELAHARERQAQWLCELVDNACIERKLSPLILGTAFKAGSNIETGSAALLCKRILNQMGWDVATHDPLIDGPATFDQPWVFLVGCNHPQFKEYHFPEGSVIIDPWRHIPYQQGVEVIGVGR